MIVSFNIPTYNRALFLKKSLEKIVKQIEELHLQDQVEINLSDNASTDNTKEVWDNCVSEHPSVKFSYKRNEKNMGPDENFLSAMHMATGQYSLLWGDDDYLKEGGLKRIMELVDYGKQNDVHIMLSSTCVINSEGNYLHEKNFLREDIEELLVDFSDISQVRGYFFLLRDMGGLLSFISDVIYRTSIIEEIEFDKSFVGTHYAFLNYWWGWLSKGKKLYYSKKSFIDETEQYQPAYGFGVNRFLIDYNGYIKVAKLFNEIMAKEFLYAFQNLHSYKKMRRLIIRQKNDYQTSIEPLARYCGYDNYEICELYSDTSTKNLCKELLLSIMPSWIYRGIVKIKKHIP
jgi:abequosyltransferase